MQSVRICFNELRQAEKHTDLWTLASLIWSRDIICLHILLHRKKFLCSKICKVIMSLDQMRDPNVIIEINIESTLVRYFVKKKLNNQLFF